VQPVRSLCRLSPGEGRALVVVVMAFTTSHLMCQVSVVYGLESTPFDTLLQWVIEKNDALACDGLAFFSCGTSPASTSRLFSDVYK
jgi:hypothetical protein